MPISDPAQGDRHAALLVGLIATSLVGAIVTWLFRIETAGVDLETIGQPEGTEAT